MVPRSPPPFPPHSLQVNGVLQRFLIQFILNAQVCVRVCMCACVRACVCMCVCVCVCVCAVSVHFLTATSCPQSARHALPMPGVRQALLGRHL